MSKPVLKACLRRRRNALLPFLLIWLTGCATSVETVRPNLPDAPEGLVACTAEPVPGLPGEPGSGWNTPQAVGIIGDQRASALSKDRCSHNWSAFYSDLRRKLSAP